MPEDPIEAKLPRRDYVILPLLGLMTMGIVAGTAVLVAQRQFSRSETSVQDCMQVTDPARGSHGRANAMCAEKGSETELTAYRLNSCGYRMDSDCGPPQPGTYRIVMVGSSAPMGQWLRPEQALAGLLPSELSSLSGRKVEVFNESIMSEHPELVAARFDEVLAAKPDLVLWILTPTDVGDALLDQTHVHPQLTTFQRPPLIPHIQRKLKLLSKNYPTSELGVMLQHYLYQSQNQYVRSYVRGQDSETGFLAADPSAAWRNDLMEFDKDAAKVEGEANAAGVPMAVALVPNRAQAAMISMRDWPPGFDPYKLGNQLRQIVESHGGIYLDILPDYRNIPNPEQGYFPVDGHPNAEGHATISRLLAKKLTNGSVPELRANAQLRIAAEQGK